MQNYTDHVSTRQTPQTEAIPGRELEMSPNKAGGYNFDADHWTRLRRFLVLGSEGGTYYVNERDLTRENAEVLFDLIRSPEDGVQAVDEIVDVSTNRRAVKSDPALFALAVASGEGADEVRSRAYEAFTDVVRTGTHLFKFLEYRKSFAGWGRGIRRAVSRWYNSMDEDRLAYYAIKYRQRYGWEHRDVLRLAHPTPSSAMHDAIYHWMVHGEWKGELRHPQIQAHEYLAANESAGQYEGDIDEAVELIREHRLPREAIPTPLFGESVVWDALLDDMPSWATVRNLGKLTSVDVLEPMGERTSEVVERLSDDVPANMHPVRLLAALVTYENGSGHRGSLSWSPVREIVDGLNDAFYQSFEHVEPTRQRIALAVDVSSSMRHQTVSGLEMLQATQAAAAMAMTFARTEDQYQVLKFNTSATPVSVSDRERLDDVVRKFSASGGTDCASPIRRLMDKGREVDAFIIVTDEQTWAGRSHVPQVMDEYRRKVNSDARLVSINIAAYCTQMTDPTDNLSLNVVGFDTSTPELVARFLRGEF